MSPEAEHRSRSKRSDAVLSAKILVVDDMDLMRNLIGNALEGAGYSNIAFAEDGEAALEVVKADRPDIVILDLSMPKINGYEVTRSLRADAETKHIPILVQSASETPEERTEVFNAGATDFVSKPINKPELLSRVTMHLEKEFLIRDLTSFRQRMRTELGLSRDMQQALMPREDYLSELYEVTGLRIRSYNEMSSELGGDLWGAWMTPAGHLGIFIIDISGHGVRSALSTFTLHSLMQRYEIIRDDPAAFLTALNGDLKETLPTGQFATMGYFVFDQSSGHVTYSAAAAPRPLIVRAGDEPAVDILDTTGYPLGVVSDPAYENRHFRVEEGDLCFFYSDVMIEGANPSGDSLLEEGLIDLLTDVSSITASDDIVETLIARFKDHLAGPMPDDLTAVSLHIHALGASVAAGDAPIAALTDEMAVKILHGHIHKPVTEDMVRDVLRRAVSPSLNIGTINSGSFSFKTREEALQLCLMISKACPDPVTHAVGLIELTVNAVEHGILGIGAEEKISLVETGRLADEVKERRAHETYAKRVATIDITHEGDDLVIVISDEGDGFDVDAVLRGFDVESDQKSGRGIYIAKSCFDSLDYNDKGNEVVVRLKAR